ncbi:unnamed protein product [marine sediment metagenome]|uniref:Gfo/Idh/MocA-like oxidoreductase N-terminal domain-containing protein n=1 Tax=marine sediment metagenome TaxID=412755 RepID=X0ST16_9ZZZZ
MNNNKKIVIGIIGGGRIGKIHAMNILYNFPEVKLKYVYDINIKEVKKWADVLKIDEVTQDLNKILKDKEVNTIFICTPTPTHVDYIIEFANTGKDIFCEKPIDLLPDKINEALKVVNKNKVKLQVGFMKRFDRNYMRLKELIDEGEVGRPYLIKMTSRDPFFPPIDYLKSSGGIFLDMTCHDFDLLRYLAGDEVEEIFAIGEALIEPRIENFGDSDIVLVNLKLKDGIMALIENSRKTNYGYDQRIEVFGSKACMIVENPGLNQISYRKEEKIINENPNYWFLERYSDAYVEEVKYFFEALRNDQAPLVTGLDSLKTILIGLAAIKSKKEKRSIKVNYDIINN